MGWLGRKTVVWELKSNIREASRLPLDQRIQLASAMEEFIEGIKSVMQTPDHPSELKRLLNLHGGQRSALKSGGFSAAWVHHAFRESYVLALIKAPRDPQWFSEVHTLLYGIRGPLNLFGIGPQDVTPSRISSEVLLEEGSQESEEPESLNEGAKPAQSSTEWYYCKNCGHGMRTHLLACLNCDAPKKPEDFLRWQHDKRRVISTTGESLHKGECGPAKPAASQTKGDAPKKSEERLQLDTHRSITITPAHAARGCMVRVQTETGTKITLSIPENTESGTKFRLAGMGKKMGGRVGDLCVAVNVDSTKDGN